jgi:hypothetical protein
VLTLLIGTLVGVFLTSSGIVLTADTAQIASTRPGAITYQRKIEVTGDRSGAALTGTAGWETRRGASAGPSANFRGVFRDISARLRRMRTVPVATQVETLIAALKREAESKVFLDIAEAFPDGDILTVVGVGYEGAHPVVHYAKLRIEPRALRFVVERGRVSHCWLLAGKPAAAVALIDDDLRLPDSLRNHPAVAAIRPFRRACPGPLADADVVEFFRIAVETTGSHGTTFGIPDGSVGGDLNVLRITERGVGEIELIPRP